MSRRFCLMAAASLCLSLPVSQATPLPGNRPAPTQGDEKEIAACLPLAYMGQALPRGIKPLAPKPIPIPVYSKEVLAAYKDTRENTPLRKEIAAGARLLAKSDIRFPAKFKAPSPALTNQFKESVAQLQKDAGLLMYNLGTHLEDLEGMSKQRDQETKVWQANYDYVRARLNARIALAYEYNGVLGDMRKEFPARDPDKHSGWCLQANPNFFSPDAKKYAAAARQLFDQLAREHKGTPWEYIAQRDQAALVGLEWQPMPKSK